jgi:group I intron endonuclease
MKKSGVYHIVNEVNGHSYVGSSVDIYTRWKKWKFDFKKPMRYNSILKSAVQKYGIEHFTFIILEECEPIKEALEATEQYYIDTLKPEYNMRGAAYVAGIGNKSRTGYVCSEERKQAHREYQTAKMADPANRAKIASKMRGVKKNYDVHTKGKPRPDEVKQKISESNRKSPKRKEFSESRRGKPNLAISTSGEYGVNWRTDMQKWIVKIDNKKYGAFDTIEEAKVKRDLILATPVEQRIPNRTGAPSGSGHYGIQWNKQQNKWIIRFGKKYFGGFADLAEAISRRDDIVQEKKAA